MGTNRIKHLDTTTELLHTLLADLPEQEYQRLLVATEADILVEMKDMLVGRDTRWELVWPLFVATWNIRRHAIPYFDKKKDNAWLSIEEQLHITKLNSRPGYRILLAAASMLIIGLFSWWIMANYYTKNLHEQHYSYVKEWRTNDVSSPVIVLPDSTRVWLNANSSVGYIRTTSTAPRQVKLTGEAYFEVKSSPSNPFYVHLDQGTVMVTGTRFFAGRSPRDGQTYVDLREGHVDFLPYGFATETVKLAPSQLLSISNKGIQLSETDLRTYSWLKKPRDLKNAPLKVLAKQLEAWYKISISIDPRAENIPFSGVMDPTQSLASHFEKIQWTSTLAVSGSNGKYSIHLK